MNFQVNGIPYFLTFDTSEAQWLLVKPSFGGFESLQIHHDSERQAAPDKSSPFPGTPQRLN
jgi:hypothetical protein